MPAAATAQWIAAGLAVALLGYAGSAQSQNPNALWDIVHGQCVPEQRRHGDPKPCAEVALADGYAILKDLNGATQFLLIPTERVTGIEAPALLAPQAVNYFSEAWQARGLVEKALGRPLAPDMLSLAINSQPSRSQNQLHIHIDCIRRDVRDQLRRERFEFGRRWKPLPVLLAGHRYRAMRVTSRSLAAHNPFKLLAAGVPGARADMGRYTLVVAGMRFADDVAGFVILEDHADSTQGDNASGEELQDHACALGQAGR